MTSIGILGLVNLVDFLDLLDWLLVRLLGLVSAIDQHGPSQLTPLEGRDILFSPLRTMSSRRSSLPRWKSSWVKRTELDGG